MCRWHCRRLSRRFSKLPKERDHGRKHRVSKFSSFQIPIAPFPEQRRIVAEIETQFTRLHAAVAALERARANLNRYRAAVLESGGSPALSELREAGRARSECTMQRVGNGRKSNQLWQPRKARDRLDRI